MTTLTTQNTASQQPAHPGTPRFYAEHMQHMAQMEMRGDSMTGTLKHGDILYINTQVTAYAGDGVYVIDRGHGPEVRRVQQSISHAGKLMLVCDHDAYQTEYVDPEALNICGQVVGFITARSTV